MFQKLGRFEIKGLLGRGAMGEVYLGVDPSLGREVALKTILATAAQGEEAKQRFGREAKAAGVLNHPNIVTIYEFGEDQGVLYIAMERVRGQDLEEMFLQRSITPSEALEVLAQVCDGLEFAHRNQIIHRDIKPSNIRVLRDGRRLQAKVMDFGVARLKDSEMTATGTVVGTVSYMAPEYIRTGKPDARSDLFAVGVMLYESISGRRPFEGDTTPTILYKIVNEPPDPVDLSQLREISPAIRHVLDTALAKDPAERFQTADEFAHALRAAKDPTWQGRVQDATVAIGRHAQTVPPLPTSSLPTGGLPTPAAPTAATPTAAAATASMTRPAGTAQVPAARPTGSRVAVVIAVVAVLVLGAVAGGGLILYKLSQARKEFQALQPAPAPQAQGSPAADPPAPGTPAPAQAAPAPAVPAPAAPKAIPTPAAVPTPVPSPASSPKTFPAAPLPSPQPPAAPPSPRPAAPPAAAPEPEPAGAPTTERKNSANVSLSEAITLVDSNPAKAVEMLRSAIAADPGLAQAYAWLVVALYEQQRYQEIPAVFAKARQNGIGKPRLMSNIRFRMAMQNDRLNHKIPGGTGGDE